MQSLRSMGRLSFTAPTVAGLFFAVPASAAFIVTNYIGGAGGNWGLAANWDAGVPNDGGGNTFHAVIDSLESVTLNIMPSVTELTLDSGALLFFPNDADLVVNGPLVSNSGTIALNSIGNGTDLRINNNTLFTGAGTIALSNNVQNRIFGQGGSRTFTNDSLQLIRGSGQLGVNLMLLVNIGLIQADQPSALSIDLAGVAADNVNFGTFKATNGATLSIASSEITNAGTILAEEASRVDLSNALIEGGVLQTTGTGAIRTVTAGAGTQLNSPTLNGLFVHPNDADAVLRGTLTNNGSWQLQSIGNGTDIYLDSDVVLTGPGKIEFSNNIQNRIFGINAIRTLVNDTPHLIRGSGQIGVNTNMLLQNLGIVRADQPNTLTIDLVGDQTNNINFGTLEATNGATLSIVSSAITNAGTIHADEASRVDLSNALIEGGVFQTTGTGAIRTITAGAGTQLNSPTLNGLFVNPNDADAVLRGTLTNNGSWQLLSVGNGTDIYLDSDVVLTGPGAIEFSNNIQNRIFGINATRTLVNDTTHLIRGSGQIGVNTNMLLQNLGIVRADQPNTLTIDLVGDQSSNVNFGTLEAVNNATLRIDSTAMTNAGEIRAENGSLVDLANASIHGGTFETLGSGAVRSVTAGAGTQFHDVTNLGTIRLPNDADAVITGTITNEGNIQMQSVGNGTDLYLNSDVLLTGAGSIDFSNNVQNRILGLNAQRLLINGVDHVIQGAGQIGVNTFIDVLNQGGIVASQSNGITIDPTTFFQNDGFLGAIFGNLAVAPATFTNQGTIQINAGRSLTRTGGVITQNSGTTIVSGSLSLSGSSLDLNGGTLFGGGSITGTVNAPSGLIFPGDGIGKLSISSACTLGDGGGLAVQVAGATPVTQHDQLQVGGAFTANGVLQVARAPSYLPAPRTEHTIVTAASVTGVFDSVGSCDTIEVIYTANSVKIKFPRLGTITADLNGDDIVDGADFGILLAAWGSCAGCCPGDLNGDLMVDGADVGLFLADWG